MIYLTDNKFDIFSFDFFNAPPTESWADQISILSSFLSVLSGFLFVKNDVLTENSHLFCIV